MIVSRSKRFIFIGIQKTATTTIEAALEPYRNGPLHRYYNQKHKMVNRTNIRFKHVPAEMARRIVGASRWEHSFTFTFVRNPWARTLSEFTGHRHQPEYEPYRDMSIAEGFRAWVSDGGNWLAKENSMKDFVTDENGKLIVEFVGKIENLNEDWVSVGQRIGIPTKPLNQLNRSPEKVNIRSAYDDETAATVYEWIKEDLAYFSYDLEKPG